MRLTPALPPGRDASGTPRPRAMVARVVLVLLLAASALICFVLEIIGRNISGGIAGAVGVAYVLLALALAFDRARRIWFVLGALALIPTLLFFTLPVSLS